MIKFGCNEIDKKSKLQSHREIINLMMKKRKKRYIIKKIGRLCLVSLR